MLPAGVVQVWAVPFARLSFVTKCSATKLPAAPLSRSARTVTGLGFPCRVLSRTNASGLRLTDFAFLLEGWLQMRLAMDCSSTLSFRQLSRLLY